MSRIQFPIRGRHWQQTMRNLTMAMTASGVVACVYAVLYKYPKQVKYRTFYSTYDPMASFERMADGGYFDAVPPTGLAQKRKDADEKVKAANKKKAEDKKKAEKEKKEKAKKG